MAIDLNTYVDVQITSSTQGVSRSGFGTPIILGEVSEFSDRTKSYSGISEIASDFSSTSEVYLKAAAIFSQTPRPKTIKVGRKLADVNAKQQVVFDATATAGTFTLTLGTETTSAIAYDADAATIKTAIEALTAVTAVTVTVLAASKSLTIEFTGADASTSFSTFTAGVGSLTSVTSATITVLQYGSSVETWTTAITNIVDFDNDWYGMCITSKVDADILLVAASIQTLNKIFIALSNDATIPTSATDDIATDLKTAGYTRTGIIYSDDTDSNLDAGILGTMLTYQAGSATWAYKAVAGESITDFTSSERSYAIAKKCNIYHLAAGKNIFDNGTMASGEFIDNIIAIDFMVARIGEDIFQAITDADKIPYTDAGIGVIKGILDARLSSSVNQGIIDTYTIEVPTVADTTTTERANRLLPDVDFNARLQGAIHFIEVTGRVTV